ncbi:Sec63 Brl domain-domain-containing protein [Phakopsora pachyrhizi]|uniref:Sec63 Brl domain-domain-containing protein n=1 Tax=Phakopsora pachyrhizi TaxID=170000 RepID=A0AAV0BGF0_PHAPC|nr:Sec63 Brl domain-domain-containing protein [Phakopsora pachyrhizi]
MTASYEYDETGQSGFFLFTFLLLVLIPWSVSLVQRLSKRTAPPPCPGWNSKVDHVSRLRGLTPSFDLSLTFLVLGWALLGYVAYRASFVKPISGTYDPFSILGISPGLDEKQIKRHFKRLSIKFHPDKLRLKDNQTIEQVNEHFVNITKAYKALTDETIRTNFELYGHPDGKRETSMGIALPKWIVESQNHGYVIGFYGIVFGLMLPYFVAKWWHGSRRFTKDLVMNDSAAIYFLNLTENTKFSGAVEVLSASLEFKALESKNLKVFNRKDFKKLEDQVITTLFNSTGEKLKGKLYDGGERYVERTAVLIYAHLFRIPISDLSILKFKHQVINHARHLTSGMQSITLGYSWLSTFLVIISLQQSLVQAIHPSLSPLLQLPHIPLKVADRLAKEHQIVSPEQFAALTEKEQENLVPDLKGNDQLKKHVLAVAKHWPKLEIVSSEFKVVGEKYVTPGCVIQFTMKVKIAKPKTPDEKRSEEEKEDKDLVEQDLTGEELGIDELLGRKKAGSDGEENSPLVHAPHTAKDIKPSYYLFVGDHKLNRIFVQPIKFTDVGYTKTRVIRTSFQAPQGPGLYTFQAYVRSDSYLSTDVQASMQLRVESPDSVELVNDEDEISEPDEDTLAGQMAAMRGQPTKKKKDGDSDDDDTSGTESSEEDDSSSSDSDSD